MALNLKLPKFLTGSKNPSDLTVSADTVMDAAQSVSKKAAGFSLAVMSQYSTGSSSKSMVELGAGYCSCLLVLWAHVNQEATYGSAYIATAGEMQMLSQRLTRRPASHCKAIWMLFRNFVTHTGGLVRM